MGDWGRLRQKRERPGPGPGHKVLEQGTGEGDSAEGLSRDCPAIGTLRDKGFGTIQPP